ncbi:tail protein [Salmonella enterica subsp. enterica]|nr:tail protein [Salmonella enterica subsp. enterica]
MLSVMRRSGHGIGCWIFGAGRHGSMKRSRHCREKIARDRKTPWTVSSSQTEYDQQQLNELQEQKRQKDLLDAKAQAERNYQETQKRRNEAERRAEPG